MSLKDGGARPGFPVAHGAVVIKAHLGTEVRVPEVMSAVRGLISA